VVLLVAGISAARCSDSPSQPTDPAAPHIVCPAAPAPFPATDPLGAVVTYNPATVANGTPPISGPTCTPASGSKFPIGSTTVACTVSDARARTDACTFTVVVQAAPTLRVTRFVAFGDSITAGEIVGEGLVAQGGVMVRPLLVDPFLSYPADLTRDLAVRYQAQSPFVTNAGVSGETTTKGAARLPSALSPVNQQPPQVLLLLEGANDLGSGNPSTVTPAVLNLDAMVRTGKSHGLPVFVGTLPPENPNACSGAGVPAGCVFRAGGAPLVVPFNNAVRLMAASEGVTLVDVYQAFNGNVTTLIDFDGLHPTAAGYQVIADTYFAAIRQTLEASAALSPDAFGAPLLLPLPRRR